MKEVCLDSRPERLNRVRLPDVPWQGISQGMDDVSDGSLAMSFYFTVFGPRNFAENKMECTAQCA